MAEEIDNKPNMHCLSCGKDFYFAGYGTAGTWCPLCYSPDVVNVLFNVYLNSLK